MEEKYRIGPGYAVRKNPLSSQHADGRIKYNTDAVNEDHASQVTFREDTLLQLRPFHFYPFYTWYSSLEDTVHQAQYTMFL